MFGDPAPTPFDPGLLRGAGDLRPLGIDPGRGGWRHVRHGAWVEAAVWATLTPVQRHAAFVHACDHAARRPGRNIHLLESAAALHGLPVIGPWPRHVNVLSASPRHRGSRLVHVHVAASVEPVTVDGLRASPVARTVIDLARHRSFESGLAAGDHALRHGLCTEAELRDEADELPPRVLGRPRARLVAELADELSMSPGESLSRARMFTLKLPKPQLQVPVEDAGGLIGLADFGWPGVVGEFDGFVKYAIPPGADPEEAQRVLWAEKQREDRFRRRVRVARWLWRDAMEQERMARILAEQGVRPVPRPVWIDLGRRRDAS